MSVNYKYQCPICHQFHFGHEEVAGEKNWRICVVCETNEKTAVTWWRAGYYAGSEMEEASVDV